MSLAIEAAQDYVLLRQVIVGEMDYVKSISRLTKFVGVQVSGPHQS